MSLIDDISGEQTEPLAVLYCDLSQTDAGASAEADLALWRVNYFRAAREMAADHGGHEATIAAGGWAATFRSTVEALVCAQALSSLVGWQTSGPSLSGGLSAGDVSRDPFGIGGSPVREAIALCHRARPRQVLVADPLKVVVAQEMIGSFAPAPHQADGDDQPVAPRPSLRLLTNRDSPGPAPGPTAATDITTDSNPDGSAGTAALRLTVLGWVRLEAGEPAVPRAVLRGGQARTVLSMLALRRGPVHKDELGETLWPAALPDHWEGALRGLITKIRRFLDAGGLRPREVLVGEGGYYELRLPPNVTVDREVATALVASTERALSQNRAVEAAILGRRAVTILERRLLSGPDNAWFDQVRAELAHDRLAALELCAQAELRAGSIEGATRAATEALALDRYRESSYRLLMQAHSAAGSRGEALRAYERCRRMLAEELGVGPAAPTQALYAALLG